jgi:hypothetical protein
LHPIAVPHKTGDKLDTLLSVQSISDAAAHVPNRAGKCHLNGHPLNTSAITYHHYRFEALGWKSSARSSRPVSTNSLSGSPATRVWRMMRISL